MITVDDCAAFCDAEPGRVHEVACREGLPLISAYARVHAMTVCVRQPVLTERFERTPGDAAPRQLRAE